MRNAIHADHPAVPWLRAVLNRRAAALSAAWREGERGASAVELAVITAVILAVALALLVVIKNFVHAEARKIHG